MLNTLYVILVIGLRMDGIFMLSGATIFKMFYIFMICFYAGLWVVILIARNGIIKLVCFVTELAFAD